MKNKCNNKSNNSIADILPVKPYEDECKLKREVHHLLPGCKGDVGLMIGRIAAGKSNLLAIKASK